MALRPESSVSVEFDEWGQVTWPGDRPSPVVHRTPEELGIPRTVPDEAPGKLMPWIDRSAVVKVRRAREHAETVAQRERRGKLRELELEMREHTIHGEPVVMSAMVSMGTEMIGAAAAPEAKQEIEGEKTMPAGQYARPNAELRARIQAEPDTPVLELVRKYGVTKSQVYSWRYEARRAAGTPLAPRAATKASRERSGPPAPIEIDPQRAGTTDALLTALARQDEAAAVVQLALTQGEVGAILAKLSAPQRQAFLAAGLRAALLA